MVGSALTFALIGLSAVSSALPTADNAVKERQTFGLGSGGSTFGTGSGQGVQCIEGVPLNEQPPCILTVIGGTFKPPKSKRFSLPPDALTNKQHAIDTLELRLEALQNKKHKIQEDYDEIEDIHAALKYLAGITSITAPPGTGTIFHPGKRSDPKAPSCPQYVQDNLVRYELEYESLLQDDYLSYTEQRRKEDLRKKLLGCGITIVKSPDGTSTTLKPSDKRQTFTVGKQTCELADVNSLKVALATLLAAYGDPKKAPQNIFLIEQVIVSYLSLCGQSVPGWTTLTPGNSIPGGAITPDPTTPGGAITPDPTTPGGEIHPSDKRQAPVSDPSALLAALKVLETQYGGYGSGTIPVPVFLIMLNMVTVLQDIPGVVVPGWPVLGAGSTSGIHPSD